MFGPVLASLWRTLAIVALALLLMVPAAVPASAQSAGYPYSGYYGYGYGYGGYYGYPYFGIGYWYPVGLSCGPTSAFSGSVGGFRYSSFWPGYPYAGAAYGFGYIGCGYRFPSSGYGWPYALY